MTRLRHRLCMLLLVAGASLTGCGGADRAADSVLQGGRAATRGNEQAGAIVSGRIDGLNGAAATVMLGNADHIMSAQVDASGQFRITGVPNGSYFVKAEASGFLVSAAQTVLVGSVNRPLLPYHYDSAPASTNNVVFVAQRAADANYRYHWENDGSVAGQEATATSVTPPSITFLDQPVSTAVSSAAQQLLHDYNIILSDEGGIWHQEYAARLLATMATIPQAVRNSYQAATRTPSRWRLTDSNIENDISVVHAAGGDSVTLSSATFTYATPKLVLLDGVKGNYFSLRLHHAAVRFVTADGTDTAATERILNERFGVSTQPADITQLTRATTGESAARFSAFLPAELLSIITMFEEMPTGFHQVKGLKYLLRRGHGQPHPRYPSSPAVAWPLGSAVDSYIEFMDSAFGEGYSTHRLVLHEKTHFLWANLFDDALRRDWAAVGAWREDRTAASGWRTSQSTTFVSAYAHSANPDEDLAESVADYVLNPALLKSRAPDKYRFIEQRIMHGDSYVPVIRADLTFQVYNLYPDLSYPGRINQVDIVVTGAPQADKLVTLDVALSKTDLRFPGATRAYFRLFSDAGTYVDVYMAPVDAQGTHLRATFSISKYAASGYWRPDQIVLTDQVGNQRFESIHDIGWKLYVNNPLEVKTKSGYVPGSLAMRLLPTQTTAGHTIQKLQVRWTIQGEHSSGNFVVYASLRTAERPVAGAYGSYDPTTHTALVEFEVTESYPTGNYSVAYISMADEAYNWTSQYFSGNGSDEVPTVVPVQTSNPDNVAPEVDLNRITVSATPTNPSAPNGETLVTIVYYARDDKSGLGTVNYRLLDPQGISHFDYHYHANFYTQFFAGDPTAWTRYELKVLLAAGSAPGTWGLQTLQVADKANNVRSYDFVELMHFTIN